MRRGLIAVGGAAVLVMSSGCAANNPSPVSATAATALAPFVSALREAASHKSVATVEARESDLVAEVESLVSSGDLTAKRGKSIEDAASALLSDYRQRAIPTPPPTSTTPSPSESDTTSPTPSSTVTVTITPTVTDTSTAGSTPTDTETSKHHGG